MSISTNTFGGVAFQSSLDTALNYAREAYYSAEASAVFGVKTFFADSVDLSAEGIACGIAAIGTPITLNYDLPSGDYRTITSDPLEIYDQNDLITPNFISIMEAGEGGTVPVIESPTVAIRYQNFNNSYSSYISIVIFDDDLDIPVDPETEYVSLNAFSYDYPCDLAVHKASTWEYGIVKTGDGISNDNGTISVANASSSTVGGIKARLDGDTLYITTNGNNP